MNGDYCAYYWSWFLEMPQVTADAWSRLERDMKPPLEGAVTHRMLQGHLEEGCLPPVAVPYVSGSVVMFHVPAAHGHSQFIHPRTNGFAL